MSVFGVRGHMVIVAFRSFHIKVINMKCSWFIKYEYQGREKAHIFADC